MGAVDQLVDGGHGLARPAAADVGGNALDRVVVGLQGLTHPIGDDDLADVVVVAEANVPTG